MADCDCRFQYLNGESERVWLATANSDLRSQLLALAAEIERLRADLAEAYDACRYALADSPRWQELAETVIHTYKEADHG